MSNDFIRHGFFEYELNIAAGVEDNISMMSKLVCPCNGCLKVMHMQMFAIMRDDHCEMFELGGQHGCDRRCTNCEDRSGHMRQVLRDYCGGICCCEDE